MPLNITKEDVEHLSATSWSNLDDQTFNEYLEIAETLMDNQFSDQVATLPTFEGDRKHGGALLVAHLLELSEGGEASSESGEGGSVTYNTVTGETLDALTETRYGRIFKDLYLRDRQGIGIVRSR